MPESNFRPLAGRPPWATEDESVYELPAQPRPARQPKPENPNARTSAYNAYVHVGTRAGHFNSL